MRPLPLLLIPALLSAQSRAIVPPEQPNPKTLLSQSLIESMVAEASGSMALNSIYDLAGYEHDRLADALAKSGWSDPDIHRFAWQNWSDLLQAIGIHVGI